MRYLNTEDAGTNARGAAIRAAIQNNLTRNTYTPQQQHRAVCAVDLLDTAYRYSAVYVNYRKGFIAVTVRDAQTRDSRLAQQVELLFDQRGYQRVETPQARIYRLPRQTL